MAKILFLDDDPLTLKLMEKAVSILNHGALLSSSVDEALLMIQDEHPDLIIVDLGLEEMSGLSFIRKLQRDPAIPRVPVVIVSAGQSDYDEEQAHSVGAVQYLRKPLGLDQLMNVINTWTYTAGPL
ncbi:MAG: response regulator [Chloroflexi bacterium]|jgi:CheY-like chemotaxis protein|nr:response regulator [Anaerolineaceae bacterium]NMB87468.1 response regulator [Chloroflexota bacterium]